MSTLEMRRELRTLPVDGGVLRALRAQDLRLAEIYPCYCRFNGDCTAAQLYRHMKNSGYEWVTITQRQFTNLYNEMIRIRADNS